MQEMQPMLYFKKERIMRKKTLALFLTCVLAAGMLAGCGNKDSKDNNQVENSQGTESAKDDQAAADEVAELIDAIYVQERTDKTDEQCAAAKEAWDKLTDAQKALVSGENADPDYFGRDTGDASKDDPLNEDNIGENEILVVSFGTSFNDSRVADIGGVEKAVQEANPDWAVRRAFTAQIIINHVQARDGEKIDNVDQALQRAVDNGVKNLVIQPTHLMHGAEYDELVGELDAYKDKFDKVVVAEPLLGEVGDDATVINDDKKAVAEDITAEAVKTAGYDSLDAAKEDGTAFVFMGHGTSHSAKVSYSQMATQMEKLGYDNVFIGTVEGEPEDTSCENVIQAVKDAGYKKVILRPLMVVAGDHANNDMAGDDDDSWKSQFTASGNFDSIDTQIAGLGEIEAVQKLYVEHTKNAIESLGKVSKSASSSADAALEDGTYTAKKNILIMAALLALSAYFSATETAFNSMNRTRVRAMAEKGDKDAELALKLSENYDRLLSTILVGNNIVNIALAAIGTMIFVNIYGASGAAISTGVVTVLVLIFGEISPKSLAKDCPEKFALKSAALLRLLTVILCPLNWLFSLWKKLLNRVFRLESDNKMSQEELLMLVDEVQQEGSIDGSEGELLKNAIEFTEREAEDILTHRVDMEAVSKDASKEDIAKVFSETKYSRLPVYDGDIDNIIGVIHQKDFYTGNGIIDRDISHIIAPAVYVLKNEKISSILKLLQRKKAHVAVVLDEYGGTCGMITMEDILEELVGEIWDEHDEITETVQQTGENSFTVDGAMDMDDFVGYFGIKADTDATSAGGWITEQLGHIPEAGDTLEYENLDIKVLSMDNHRIEKFRIDRVCRAEAEAGISE